MATKKNSYILLGILIVVALVVVAIIVINITKPKINDKEVTDIADSNKEVLLLNKVIQSQNRFSDCIDEVAKIYQQQGVRNLTQDLIEKTRICKSSINKEVTKISGDTYLVKYIQDMPQQCKSARTVSNLLNVQVDMNTKQTVGSWQNGITFTDSAIQDIDNSIAPVDCKAYAEYIGSHGTLK